MNIHELELNNGFKLPYITDLYDLNELEYIVQEIRFLNSKLGDQYETNAAPETNFKALKKKGRGVFLDNVYADRSYSDILTISRKVFHNEDIRDKIRELAETNIYWDLFFKLNYDSTLLQNYVNGDYYDYHTDESIITFISTFLWDTNIKGGELVIDDLILPLEHNAAVIFPSIIEHKVNEVIVNGDKFTDPILNGRWSIAHLASNILRRE